jgi:hypothetical protein
MSFRDGDVSNDGKEAQAFNRAPRGALGTWVIPAVGAPGRIAFLPDTRL